jgi:hypothetical protein
MQGSSAVREEAFFPALERMLATAGAELDRHTAHDGRCVACGQVWPCARVQLAALALEAVWPVIAEAGIPTAPHPKTQDRRHAGYGHSSVAGRESVWPRGAGSAPMGGVRRS